MTQENTSRTNWKAHIEAASRKICISKYHFCELKSALKSSETEGGTDLPPVSVQAHLEGVLNSADSAVEKIENAAKFASSRWKKKKVFRRDLRKGVPDFRKWFKKDLNDSISEIRNDAVHHYTRKSCAGHGWQIEVTVNGSTKNRKLLEYAEEIVKYVTKLDDLLPEIEAFICKETNSRKAQRKSAEKPNEAKL